MIDWMDAGAPVADPAQDGDLVGLEGLAGAAPVAEAAAGQGGADRVGRDLHARGNPLDEGGQGFAVGLPGSQRNRRNIQRRI